MEFEKGKSYKISVAVGFLSALLFISGAISIYSLHICSQLKSEVYELKVDLGQIQSAEEESVVSAEVSAAQEPLVRSRRQTESTRVRTGTTFTRWGRKQCGDRLQLLYEGFAGGAHYGHAGGGAQLLCLPQHPEYNQTSPHDAGGWIYGAEYQSHSFGIFPNEAHDKNIPCARCYTPYRAETIMIPAKRTCPEFWKKEYEGYLMASKNGHAQPYNYVCVDSNPEYVHGSEANKDGALLYFVQSECAITGECPPYKYGGELACVVCTK